MSRRIVAARHRFEKGLVLIQLPCGRVATADEADWPLLADLTWQSAKRKRTCYVQAKVAGSKPPRMVLMHRVIAGVVDDLTTDVDHRDGDGLNNRRDNLRIATSQQNTQNSRKQTGCSSKYKGVTWKNRKNPWHVTMAINGVPTYLGSFATEEEAARKYDDKARELHGEFARVNFPRDGEACAIAPVQRSES